MEKCKNISSNKTFPENIPAIFQARMQTYQKLLNSDIILQQIRTSLMMSPSNVFLVQNDGTLVGQDTEYQKSLKQAMERRIAEIRETCFSKEFITNINRIWQSMTV